MKKRFYKLGFTLAEVLITLAIIGVVAAMTIPSLLKNNNDTELKTAYKKKFSELSQVFDKIRADNGGSLRGAFTGSQYATPTVMDPVITQYFKVFKMAQTQNSSGNTVWHDPNNWYDVNNNVLGTTCAGCAGYILNDGALIHFNSWDINGCNYNETGLCSYITIDINGFKKPNRVGKDIFELKLYENKLAPGTTTEINILNN